MFSLSLSSCVGGDKMWKNFDELAERRSGKESAVENWKLHGDFYACDEIIFRLWEFQKIVIQCSSCHSPSWELNFKTFRVFQHNF